MSKVNLPVDGSNITPNPNNLTGEAQEYQRLQFLFPRSSTGQVVFTASPSGITYNTADYSSDVNIYNKGETGMMNLLYKLYGGAGNGWIIDAGDIFTLSPATSTTLGGVKIGSNISVAGDGTIYTTIDSTPTSSSTNAVSSGGVYSALSNKLTTSTIHFNTVVYQFVSGVCYISPSDWGLSALPYYVLMTCQSQPTGIMSYDIDNNTTTQMCIKCYVGTTAINGGVRFSYFAIE